MSKTATTTKPVPTAMDGKDETTRQPESDSGPPAKVHTYRDSGPIETVAVYLLDENFDKDNEDCHRLVSQLQSLASTIDVFDDLDECMHFLQKTRKKNIILIVTDPLDQHGMNRIHDMDPITTIFIFSPHQTSSKSYTKHWPKVHGIFSNLTQLCQSLKKTDEDLIGISFVSSDDLNSDDLNHLDPSFMYTQLIKEILFQLPCNNQALQDLVTFCREKYAGRKEDLEDVTQFEQEYHGHTPIWWYSCEKFLYKMVNKGLREQCFDSIIRTGFFINDLHQDIKQLHDKQKTNYTESFPVYRGQGMTVADFEKLKKSKGGLLAFNSFVSTSFNRNIARDFVRRSLRNPALINILFTINIDLSVSSAAFADIDDISSHPGEEEVLFSMLTVFRIKRIKQNKDDDRIWNVELESTSDSDKQLDRLLQRMREEIEGSTPLFRLGVLLIRLGKFKQAEEVNQTLFKQTNDQLEKGNLFYQLGQIKSNQGKNDQAIAHYRQALDIYTEILPADHPNIATTYNNIGLVYDNKNDYPKALTSYQKAREIYESKLEPDHPILANCYNNIASVYDNMKDYKQALLFYEKSYQIYQKKLPAKHPHIATYYSNIGLVYLHMQDYSKAMKCFENAVRIGKDTLPKGHPDLEVYCQHLESTRKKLPK